jgi:transportin-3
MATTNGSAQEAFTPVLQAVNSMRDGHREEKKAAHEYLEKFQKSVCLLIDHQLPGICFTTDSFQEEAWSVTIGMLQSDANAEAKVFAATTLKGKVRRDQKLQRPMKTNANITDYV